MENEIIKEISEDPSKIIEMNAEQVTEAREALTELIKGIRAGEIPFDKDALTEAQTLATELAARAEVLEAEKAEAEAILSEMETSLGLVEEVEEPEVEVEVVVEEEVVEAVAASAKPSLAQLAEKQKPEDKPVETPAALVASVGGAVINDRAELGRQFASLMGTSSLALGNNKIASFQTEGHKYSVVKGADEANEAVLRQVTRDAGELGGIEGALVASGGFCAPAEQLYDFFNIATRAGILVLPSVDAPRGSINLPVSPSLADFLGEAGIATEWTNANDENPTSPATKPCFDFVCPPFQECEVIAWPTCLTFGNFAARFYPEAIANATFLAGVAADRTVNAARLAYLVGAASPGDVDPNVNGLTGLARNLAGNAAFYRQRYGLSQDAPLDVVFPAWIGSAIAADIVARDSTTDYGMAAERFRGFLDDHDLRPQFVYDLDDQTSGLLPSTADILLYAPGTVVELDGGALDLGIVRDSTLNSTNDFQTFVEPFVGWCQPGHEVLLLEDVPVCATGVTGERAELACATTAAG